MSQLALLIAVSALASGCCSATLSGHASGGTTTGTGGTTTGVPCVPGPAQSLESPLVLKSQPNSITTMTSSDLNRDGMLDLIAASESGLMEGLGRSDGTYGPPGLFYSTYTVGGAIAIADLDGDGWPDMVASANVPGRPGIWAFLNDGTGTLNAPTFTLTPGQLAVQLDPGDLVSAKAPDLIVSTQAATGSAAQLMLNTGHGTFAAPASLTGDLGWSSGALAVGDLNQDGLADIVGSTGPGGKLAVLINQGDGGYQQHLYPTSAQNQIALLPRPGRAPDLLIEVLGTDGEPAIQLLTNAGDGTFSIGLAYPAQAGGSLLVGDFNNDCILDIATTSERGPDCSSETSVSLLFGDGDGGFGPPEALPYPVGDAGGAAFGLALLGPVDNPHALAVGDFCHGTVTIYGDTSRH